MPSLRHFNLDTAVSNNNYVLRHSNSYSVNFVKNSKMPFPCVPSEIFAAILRLFSDF